MGGNGVMGDFSYVEKPIKYKVSDIHSSSERRGETFRSPNHLFGIKITRGFHGIPLISHQIFFKKMGFILGKLVVDSNKQTCSHR